jgi:outer membrane protein TolC
MEMGEKHNLTYSITATQLLFSGEYLVGLKASKTYSQMTDQSFEKSQRDVKEQVTSAYYNCLIVRESKSILDSVLGVLEKSYSDLQAMQAKGFVDNISADQFKMVLINQRNLADQLARAEQLTVMGLKSAANLPYQHQLQLTDNLETLIAQAKLDAQVEASVTNTSEYKLLETQEALTTLSMQRTKSKMLPTLAAYYRHKDYITENSFNMEPKDVIGVTLSVPIFSSGQRCSQIQQSKLELEQVQNTRAQARSGMEMALSQARNELVSAQANLSAQKEQMELAKRIFGNTMKKHKMGMAGSNDISTAQKDLLSAQSAYFKAVSEALNAKLKLDKAAGNL